MAFKREIKYGSVTLDFIVECAKILGLDQSKNNLLVVLHKIGFEVSSLNTEVSKHTPCKIDRMDNVNIRCRNKPFMYRTTTVFSGRLRDKCEFPLARIYDTLDILDVESPVAKDFVSNLDFDIPSVEKTNVRKYTKKENINKFIMLDELDDFTIDPCEVSYTTQGVI